MGHFRWEKRNQIILYYLGVNYIKIFQQNKNIGIKKKQSGFISSPPNIEIWMLKKSHLLAVDVSKGNTPEKLADPPPIYQYLSQSKSEK